MTTVTPIQPITITVEQAAGVLGISRAAAYNAVRRGDIPSVRVGRRVLVPKYRLAAFIAGQPIEPKAAA